MIYTLLVKKIDGTEERIPNLDEINLERIIAQLDPDVGVCGFRVVKEKEKEKMRSEKFDVIISITEKGKTETKLYPSVNHRDLLVIFTEISEGYRKGDFDKYAITVTQD